jgi:hypothetical protein
MLQASIEWRDAATDDNDDDGDGDGDGKRMRNRGGRQPLIG